MCGIVGYIGSRKVVPIILKGLKSLEYRGYDSAGLVYLQNNKLVKYRSQGKLANLERIVEDVLGVKSHVGLGHTRWATHGAPTTENAHPHGDCQDNLVIVHNGIIENYHSLKNDLIKQGHRFTSDTDTEVLAHLIEENLDKDLVQAVRKALRKIKGSYAIGVISQKHPNIMVAARNHSPLVIGIQISTQAAGLKNRRQLSTGMLVWQRNPVTSILCSRRYMSSHRPWLIPCAAGWTPRPVRSNYLK
jgi:glucosamine--fructose-6-phosphate aminotransferase (isomerizing)